MTAESFNPTDCLERLFKIAEEIPSGVSSIPNLDLNSQELISISNGEIVKQAKEQITAFWSKFNVSEKLVNLNECHRNSPSNEQAWRPITGDTNIKPIQAVALRERKTILIEEIRKTREQSDAIQNCIRLSKEKLEQEIDKINVAKAAISNERLLSSNEDS